MTKLLMHIGQGKAGSTSIQNVLGVNRSRLRDLGVLFPETGNHTNHQDIFTHLTGDVKHHDPRLGGRRDDARKKALGEGFWQKTLSDLTEVRPNLVILSCENQFRPFSREALERLSGLVRPHFDEIEVCAYLRDPASFFLSYAQQDLKKRPVFSIPSRTYYRDTLEPWLRYGPGPVRCVRFARSVLHGEDVVTDFCLRFAGIDPARLGEAEGEANATLSAEGMEIMQRFMRGEIEAPTRYHRKRPQRMKALVEEADRLCPGYVRPRLRGDLKAAIEARAEDLGWLEETFGVSFPEVGPDSIDPESAERRVRALDRVADICDIDPERLAALLSDIVRRAAPRKGLFDLFHRASGS